ncbi:MAG: glycosyltransferase family 4 protein [bacterium]
MSKIIFIFCIKRPRIVYMLLSQNVSGFIRDSLVILISKLFFKKIVLHFHGANFHNFYNNQIWIFRKYISLIIKLADAVILQAEWLKDIFKKHINEERLYVVYNGISYNDDIIIQGNRNDNHNINVIYLNHISVAKGFVLFLKAIEKIIFETTNVNFIAAGDFINKERNILYDQNSNKIDIVDIEKEINEYFKDEQFRKRVKFYGKVSGNKKDELLKKSDIFVLPSYSEGFPISVLEAMSEGLSVVVTPVGALQEIIKDGVNGLFAKIGDPDDLKEKILFLAKNSELRKQIGDNNLALIKSKYNIVNMANQIAEVFDKI